MTRRRYALAALCALVGTLTIADLEEFRIKREESFAFAQKPVVARNGDAVSVTFETSALCDVTVAVEEPSAGPGQTDKIVRHLASGVLGPNAPQPFQKNSRKQTIVWDGKNDQGVYLDNKDALNIRVSLGLKPRFERTLYWSPKRRASQETGVGVALAAAPEGVYVFDGGQAADHVRLFSHAGDYLRTVYPFPADKLNNLEGLIRHEFPQDGKLLPVKPSYQMCTLLTSGDNALNIVFKDGRYFVGPMDPAHKGEHGRATTDLAVRGNRIALAAHRLNRLATDGGSPGLPVYGPHVDLRREKAFYKATESAMTMNLGGYDLLTNLRPHRFAFSPDGRTLYFTRYIQNYAMDMYVHNYWQHAVCRMAFDGGQEPELFLGAPEAGAGADRFNMPADVACDSRGRLYVADCGNHRVQVFLADGTFAKSISVEAPAQLAISPADELWVFSWELLPQRTAERIQVKRPYVLRRFKSADDPRLLATYDIPMAETRGKYGQCAEVDFWTDPPTIWVSPGTVPRDKRPGSQMVATGTVLLVPKGDQLDLVRDFRPEAAAEVLRTTAPENNRQRLYCNPRDGTVYVGEGGFHFQEAVKLDPFTGKIRTVPIPFDAEDMCFDANGLAYLRTAKLVARYDPATWREVPWDYGEEHEKVTYNSNSGRREARVLSGLALPVNSGWHHGGMHVSAKGNLVVGCLYRYGPEERGPRGQTPVTADKSYAPQLHPGRIVMAAYGAEYIHVWDRNGKLVHEDAVRGLGTLNGVAIDNDDNLYVLSAAPRLHDGKPHFNFLAGTLMKFKPGEGRLLSDTPDAPVPMSPESRPSRPPDLSNLPGNAWVEGAEWFYGGVGWHGKNHGLGCGCRNTRFALDYFGRSFAPEIDRYSVAVLDAAGNVILRIGQCGNVDDGLPLVREGGPQNPRPIGGDEVALMHGAYAATHTDHRLFIADIGNYRVLSVKLGYHVEERVALKNVSGEAR